MDKDEALKLALRLCDEALPKFNWGASFLDANAIQLLNTVPAVIKAALAQPAQEPVAWMWKDMRGQDVVSLFEPRLNSIPLYTIPPTPAQKTTAIHQFRSPRSVNWYDGFPDHHDGSGPYEVRTLYTAPPKRERVVFPTMLRKMWSGGEVQAWLDENVNKEKNA